MVCCGAEEEEAAKGGSPVRKSVCCTDILFLVLFILFWVGMLYVAAYSVYKGDIMRLVYGYDSYGNTCHRSNNVEIKNLSIKGVSGIDMSSKTLVHFASVTNPRRSMQICIKECPDKKLEDAGAVKKFAEDTNIRLCRYDIEVKDYGDKSLYKDTGPCPNLPVYKSQAILNRCVPTWDGLKEILNKTKEVMQVLNADELSRKILADVYTSWREIVALCFIALVFAALMILCIRFLASIFVWVIVAVAAIGSIAGTAFLWYTYADIRMHQSEKEKELDVPVLHVHISNKTAFLVLAIIATILTLVLLLVLFIMRKRFSLVVSLFHEAGKCLASMPHLLLQPIITFLFLMLFLVYWLTIFGYVATIGDATTKIYPNGFERVKYHRTGLMKFWMWYHVIGLIWTSEFILGCQQFVIAGSVAQWYFTRDKSTLHCTPYKTMVRLILHHLGSIALGSFIILLVKVPRYILMYIERKCKGTENECAKFCLKCCICCLWCLEKLLKFLNHNAYTIIAIEGKSFCPAAQKAFATLVSNVLRVAAINSVGDFVLFLGKLGTAAATAAVAILWMKTKAGMNYYIVPVIIVAAFAFLVAHCVLTIYEMVIDTLLLCFCEDCRRNDGSEGREYFMSTSLMKHVKNASRKIERIEKNLSIDDIEDEEERDAAVL